MKPIDWIFPLAVVGLTALFLVTMMIPPSEAGDEMQLSEFGRLPVVYQGRVMPIDTLARDTLMIISSRETFKDENDRTQPATRWLLEVMATPLSPDNNKAKKYKVFRIDNDQVLQLLGLPLRPGSYRYAIEEFADKESLIKQEVARAKERDPKVHSAYDKKIIELGQHYQLYASLALWHEPFLVPPSAPGEEWKPLGEAIQEARATGAKPPALISALGIVGSYLDGNAKNFNRALGEHQKYLDNHHPKQVESAGFEAFFNYFSPFFWCRWLYVLVFVFGCLSWVCLRTPLGRAGLWLAVFLVVVQFWGLIARMYLMDRPFVFVTNLYSSAVFIGWTGAIVALIIELKTRLGIGTVVAGVLGFCTLQLAPILGGGGDTLGMLQAVLDTNFWLATHVTCVTFGYAATLIAGLLGALLIILGVFTPLLDREMYRTIGRLIYGMVCFATFLSFTGTILGGIWADQSWGRFWGWDPKENGALLIVMMNALILHARWAGMIHQRGMAVLAVAGNIVTLWSWWGTNQLGVGLHAYGFNNKLTMILLGGWVAHATLMGVGVLVPMHWWRSYAMLNEEPRPAGKKSRPPRVPANMPPPPDPRLKPGLGHA